VHAHAYHALPALGAAVAKRYPLVFTPHYHGTGHSRLRTALHRPYRKCGRLLFDRADRVICVSGAEASLVASHFPDVLLKTRVIHNGVDVSAIETAAPYPKSGPVLLSAGRLERYKQVDLTLRALALLPDDHSLVITGRGPASGELEALAERLGVADRVRLLGRVSDEELHRWFRTADAYVTMSSNEAYPLTPLEALVGGARVLASDIPAHHEVASATGGTMEIVRLRSEPERLAAHLQALLLRPVQPPSIDSWDAVTEMTLALYAEVLSERGATRERVLR
jgi:glycosyltransferase involved in cell wall biosynthesis